MASPFLGELMIVGFNFAPRGWANCDGQLLPIAQNTALFSLYGTTYGGDGRTSFGLPDLRGRAPISEGAGPGLPTYPQGTRSGEATVTLTQQTVPSHTHTFKAPCNSGDAGTDSPVNGFAAKGVNSEQLYEGSSNAKMGQGTTGNAGGAQSHDNMQPYQVLRYICALTGTYPSRN